MKPPVWINIPDLIVQMGIPIYTVSISGVSNLGDLYGAFLYTCLLGGPWQLFSHFVHGVLRFPYNKKTFRSYHITWSIITLLILFAGFVIHVALPILALIMGGILYILYMSICFSELLGNDGFISKSQGKKNVYQD